MALLNGSLAPRVGISLTPEILAPLGLDSGSISEPGQSVRSLGHTQVKLYALCRPQLGHGRTKISSAGACPNHSLRAASLGRSGRNLAPAPTTQRKPIIINPITRSLPCAS